MKIATARIKGVSPYQMSKYHEAEKKNKESAADYDARTWRERAHFDDEGFVYIPPMAFKQALTGMAQYLGETVKGKGKSTWTKHFQSGVLTVERVYLYHNGKRIHKDDLVMERYYCNADGKRGSGKRVFRHFPTVRDWEADLQIIVLDESITEDKLEDYLSQAGKFKGVGRFRPENGGYYGRFLVEKMDVVDA